MISLDLALVNFLPIPALDGGHFMFLLIEQLRGKPVDEESSEYMDIKIGLDEKYTSIHAITGIPCLNSQSGYPDSVEYLMGGQRTGSMAYLVVAEPIPEQQINNIKQY